MASEKCVVMCARTTRACPSTLGIFIHICRCSSPRTKKVHHASCNLHAAHCTPLCALHTAWKYQINVISGSGKHLHVEVILWPVFAPPVKYSPEFSLTLLLLVSCLNFKDREMKKNPYLTPWHFSRTLNTIYFQICYRLHLSRGSYGMLFWAVAVFFLFFFKQSIWTEIIFSLTYRLDRLCTTWKSL